MKFRTNIEATLKRHDMTRRGPEPELLTRLRKELCAQYPQDNHLLTRAELAALVAGHDADRHLIQILTNAALENADRMFLLDNRCGQLMVENDRLRALAYPIEEPAEDSTRR